MSGSTLYCTNSPCVICSKMIINADSEGPSTWRATLTNFPGRCCRRPEEVLLVSVATDNPDLYHEMPLADIPTTGSSIPVSARKATASVGYECLECERRFTTYERVEEILPLVIKKDGRRQPFERLKVIAGMQRACEKRPVSFATIEQIVDDLERQLQECGEREIDSSRIGKAVMDALHEIDEVAYVRFASVYRQFKDINEFMAELKDILAESGTKKSG
ncbi:MAG: transcriptional regulator NrdR [Syntrophotaleaceae bacterium]